MKMGRITKKVFRKIDEGIDYGYRHRDYLSWMEDEVMPLGDRERSRYLVKSLIEMDERQMMADAEFLGIHTGRYLRYVEGLSFGT